MCSAFNSCACSLFQARLSPAKRPSLHQYLVPAGLYVQVRQKDMKNFYLKARPRDVSHGKLENISQKQGLDTDKCLQVVPS